MIDHVVGSAGGVVVGALRAAPAPVADVVSVAGVRDVAPPPPPSRVGARVRIQLICDVQGQHVGRVVRAGSPPGRAQTQVPLKREGTHGALA